MKNRYIISLLLLLPSFIGANEYHISESYSISVVRYSLVENNALTAVLQSDENFETSTNPIPVSVLFSEEVMEFDESYILVYIFTDKSLLDIQYTCGFISSKV